MRISALVCGLTFLISAVAAQSASAQEPGETRSTFRMAPRNVHPVGAYGGVQPGVKRAKVYKERRPVVNKSRRRNIVRWIGFQPRPDGSRVFVQLTGEVEYTQRLDGSDLVVSLDKARLGGRNARRPLDTRFFKSAIRRAVAKRVRRVGVEIRISFKNPADAGEASATMSKNDKDGFTYLFLDFGQGTKVSPKSDAADADADEDIQVDDDE